CIRRRWERHAVEAVEARRREEPERVPPHPPRIANPRVRVENHERQPSPGQVIADREPGLPGSDHDRLDALAFTKGRHTPPRLLAIERDARSPAIYGRNTIAGISRTAHQSKEFGVGSFMYPPTRGCAGRHRRWRRRGSRCPTS